MLLGDAWLEKQKINARFRFEQSHIRADFFFDVFKYFSFYIKNTPSLREREDKRTGKVYKTWHLSTLSLPFLNEYYNLFYKKININGKPSIKKVIPNNNSENLTAVSLAYWIACDGYKYNKGVALATNSFSVSDNNILINALKFKFGLNCWIISDHGLPSIFIPHSDLNKLQNFVLPYLHNSLLYKIHL